MVWELLIPGASVAVHQRRKRDEGQASQAQARIVERGFAAARRRFARDLSAYPDIEPGGFLSCRCFGGVDASGYLDCLVAGCIDVTFYTTGVSKDRRGCGVFARSARGAFLGSGCAAIPVCPGLGVRSPQRHAGRQRAAGHRLGRGHPAVHRR